MRRSFSTGAVVLAAALLSGTAIAGGPVPGASELGVKLADLLTAFVPAEIYHQRLVSWSLSGGEVPSPDPAREAIERGSELLDSLEEVISATCWEGLEGPVQTASQVVRKVLVLFQEAPDSGSPTAYEPLARELGSLKESLDRLVLSTAQIAEKLGAGWAFQAAFIAQTVLNSPSPLYLQLPPQGLEYLKHYPPDISPKAKQAMETLLGSANRFLSPPQEEAARRAAETLIESLTGRAEGRS